MKRVFELVSWVFFFVFIFLFRGILCVSWRKGLDVVVVMVVVVTLFWVLIQKWFSRFDLIFYKKNAKLHHQSLGREFLKEEG